nr:conotoxin precursor Cerm04 [Conus ebraeus]
MKLSVVVIVLMLAMAFTHGSLLHNVGKALRRYNRHVRDTMADKRDKRTTCQSSKDCTPPLVCRRGVCDLFDDDMGG